MLFWTLAIPYYIICFLFFYNARCVLGAGAVTATPTTTATAATSTSTNNVTLLDNSTSIAFSPGWELAFSPDPQNGTFAFTNQLDGFIVAVLPVNTVAFSYVGFRRSTGAHYLVCLDCSGSNSSAGLVETVDGNDPVEGDDEVPVPLFTFSDLDPTTSHTLEVYNLPDIRFGNTSQLTFVSLEVSTSTFASIEPTLFSAVVPTSTTTASSTTPTSTSTSTTSSTSSASTATSTTTQNNANSRTLSTSLIAVIAILSLLAVLSLVLGLLVLSRTRRRRKSQLLPGRPLEEGRMSQVTPFSNNINYDNNNTPYSPINTRAGRESLPIASIYETGGALPQGTFRSLSSPQQPVSAAQRQGRPPSRPVNPYSMVYPSDLPLEAPSRYNYAYYGNDNSYRGSVGDIGESPAPSPRSYSPGGGGGRERLPQVQQQRRPQLNAYGRTASNQTWVSRTPR